ncbi:MAG: DUF1501 domain-containing protein [Pseudomonadota bacterium]
MTRITRRGALALVSAGVVLPAFNIAVAQGVGDRKFVFIILRGAMDGLSALIPDDAETDRLRGALNPARNERLDLGNGFRLHPRLTTLRAMYGEGEAAFVHAAATSFRDRSHFDAQDALETLSGPGARSGWLNRALAATGATGLAVGYSLPLVLKGPSPATNWSPAKFPAPSEDLLGRLERLYANDDRLAASLSMARSVDTPDVEMSGGRNPAAQYAAPLSALGELMSADGGPGVGVASLDGWDTHAGQKGGLDRRFGGLDAGLAALKSALGRHWSKSVVVLASEFGRTAKANGTGGTDHGTGGLVMLVGGAVSGGRLHGDWPGLKTSDLYEGRDLYPATDVAAILKGVLRDHLGVDQRELDQNVLPGGQRAIDGLISA